MLRSTGFIIWIFKRATKRPGKQYANIKQVPFKKVQKKMRRAPSQFHDWAPFDIRVNQTHSPLFLAKRIYKSRVITWLHHVSQQAGTQISALTAQNDTRLESSAWLREVGRLQYKKRIWYNGMGDGYGSELALFQVVHLVKRGITVLMVPGPFTWAFGLRALPRLPACCTFVLLNRNKKRWQSCMQPACQPVRLQSGLELSV